MAVAMPDGIRTQTVHPGPAGGNTARGRLQVQEQIALTSRSLRLHCASLFTPHGLSCANFVVVPPWTFQKFQSRVRSCLS